MFILMILGLCAAVGATSAPTGFNCVWDAPDNDHRCNEASYGGIYPDCSVYQRGNGDPIACGGRLAPQSEYCAFTGRFANSTPPMPASWHVHVFFPNPACDNCYPALRREDPPAFTRAGAMQLRGALASALNDFAGPGADTINVTRAAADPTYRQCLTDYQIAAGAPANFHARPCIYEVDEEGGGPFVEPRTGEPYPNYSFFLPGPAWMPGLYARVKGWLRAHRGAYPALLHPNTGCETRDHTEAASIEWLGGGAGGYALDASIFSCGALGCNQACPSVRPTRPLPAPAANCSWGG